MNQSALTRAADRMIAIDDLAPGACVIVACSGGADSLALLALAAFRGFDVTAAYVDHGLRTDTAHDVAIVTRAVERVGARIRTTAVTIAPGPNLEARARDARYGALADARAAVDATAVLIAHTRDDQAETVLLNLLRGSGTAGLAGMPARRGAIRRPLLALRRAETREICFALGFTPAHDPMNDDVKYRRVWLRREIIPRLEHGADRDIVEVLARQADVLRDDDDVLDALAAGNTTNEVSALNALPNAVARRVVRQWLGRPPASFATIERVLAVARGDAVATELPGGDRVQRVGGRLVRATGAATTPDPTELALPGRATFGSFELEAWIEHGPPVRWPDGKWVAVCDADLVPAALVVRAAEQGPAPVLSASEPVWAVGYRIDNRVRVTTRTRRFLWLRCE